MTEQTLKFSLNDIHLLRSAATALVEKTAHQLALLTSTEGEMYAIAKEQHEQARNFNARIIATLEHKE